MDHSQTTHFLPGTARLMVADVAQVLHQWQEVAAMWMGQMMPQKQRQLGKRHGGLKWVKVGCIFSFCKPSYIRRTWRNMLQTHWINCRAELVSKISAINVGRDWRSNPIWYVHPGQFFLGIRNLQYWIYKFQEATCLAKEETCSNRTYTQETY